MVFNPNESALLSQAEREPLDSNAFLQFCNKTPIADVYPVSQVSGKDQLQGVRPKPQVNHGDTGTAGGRIETAVISSNTPGLPGCTRPARSLPLYPIRAANYRGARELAVLSPQLPSIWNTGV